MDDDTDTDAALTWEALQSVGSDDHDDDDGTHDLTVGIHTSHPEDLGASDVHSALDADDHDAFPPLDELSSFADPSRVQDAAVSSTTVVADVSAEHGRTSSRAVRSKRKNFSKHLQVLSLERYADHTRVHGKLPDRSECQLLLHHSFAQFVREGGSATHPRIAYAEFLKLIRNRSAERQRRQQHQVDGALQPELHRTSVDDSTSSGTRRRQNKKTRKRVDAYDAKIDALIEEIDRVRRPIPTDETSAAVTTSTTEATPTAQSSDAIVDMILRVQHDARQLQHQLHARLARLHDQCTQHEPSSASV